MGIINITWHLCSVTYWGISPDRWPLWALVSVAAKGNIGLLRDCKFKTCKVFRTMHDNTNCYQRAIFDGGGVMLLLCSLRTASKCIHDMCEKLAWLTCQPNDKTVKLFIPKCSCRVHAAWSTLHPARGLIICFLFLFLLYGLSAFKTTYSIW